MKAILWGETVFSENGKITCRDGDISSFLYDSLKTDNGYSPTVDFAISKIIRNLGGDILELPIVDFVKGRVY